MTKRNGYNLWGKLGVFATLALAVCSIVLWVVGEFADRLWILLDVGLLATILGGLRFFVEAVRELRARAIGQYILGSIGLLILVGFALVETLVFSDSSYWLSVSVVSATLSLTHWWLRTVAARVAGSARDLVGLLPETADVLDGSEIQHLRVSEVEVGDIVVVRPGSYVPVDGVVVQGESVVDESLLTGEEHPVAKSQGSDIFAGTLNASAKRSNKTLTIRATALPGDLLVENFTRRVERLAAERGLVDTVSAKLSLSLFLLTLASALVAGGLWLVLSPADWAKAVVTAAAVLLSVNLAIVSGSSALVSSLLAAVSGAKGILVRSRTALYRLRKSHIVVMNMIGTLTMGTPQLVNVHLAKGTSLGSEAEVLSIASALEANSEHALARAIVEASRNKNIEPAYVYELEPHLFGFSGRMDGSSLLIGSAGILTAYGVHIDVQDFLKVSQANERGNSVVYLVIDNLLVAYLEFSDEVRATAREAVRRLQASRKRVIVLTGEAEGVATAVCSQLGISEHFAECTVERKLAVLDELKLDGSIITAVGDARADAQVLASADVAIALGVGGELGTESADVLVVSNEPRAVGRIMSLAVRSTRAVTLSLVFVSLLDIAALAFSGFLGEPIISAALVLLSSLIGGGLILRLRRS